MRLTGTRHGCCNRISRARWQFPGRAPAASYLLPSPCAERERSCHAVPRKKGKAPTRPGRLGNNSLLLDTFVPRRPWEGLFSFEDTLLAGRKHCSCPSSARPTRRAAGDGDGKQLSPHTCSSSRRQRAARSQLSPAPRATWFALLGGTGSNAVQVDEQ